MKTRILMFICWLLLAVATFGAAAAEVSAEYRVKAACLFNFTKFVEWPDDAFAGPGVAVEIGILGENPFGEVLGEIVRDQSVRGRPLAIKRSDTAAALKGCQVVFVSRGAKGKARDITAELAGPGVLLVGESDGFAEQGGSVNFFLQGAKVRFEINVKAAQKQGLKISSQLLGLAKIVGKKE